jgi:BMFP domain-containing protein YqiC
MPAPIDELHGLVEDLEDEGHSLAGRFRDLVDHIKSEFAHLLGGGKNELDAFVKGLVGTLVPELDKVKDEIVAQVLAELRKVTDEVKAVVASVETAAPADSADDAAPAAPEQVEPAPAPAQG